MSRAIWTLSVCLLLIVSAVLPGSNQTVLAADPPGTPVVTGTPGLNTTVVVFPYDTDLYGIYLVIGNNMQPVTSVPVEHINLDKVTAKLAPDGNKVAYLVEYGSTGFSRLVVIGADGLNSQMIFESDQPDKYITSFAWSHDSLKLAYSLSADQSALPADLNESFANPDKAINPLAETVLKENAAGFTGEVWAADIMTKDSYQLVDSGAQDVLGWTSSDAGVLFSEYSTSPTLADDPAVGVLSPVPVPEAAPAGVSVVLVDGGLNTLVEFPTPTTDTSKVYFDVALLEDGAGGQKLAALSATGAFETIPEGVTTLEMATVPPDSGPAALDPITLTKVLESDTPIASLSLSPSGGSIAYSTTDNALWTAQVNGTNQAMVTSSGVDNAAQIHWNATSSGVTAQALDGRELNILALNGTEQGSLITTLADALANPEPWVLADVRNYNVPFVHQLWDTPDAFNGRCACGPTSTAMAMAFYQKLSPHSITVNTPSQHTNDYGFYVSEDFPGFTSPYSASPCPGSNGGLYGEIVRGGAGGREYIQVATQRLGISSTFAQYQSTFDIVKSALDRGHLVILSTDLTGAGHIILVKGYTNDNKIIVNDPYGNAFGGTYGQKVIDGASEYYAWSQVKPKWYLEVNGTPPDSGNPPPTITHWKGEYYNNTGLSGSPSLVRNDTEVSFDWGSGVPGSGINNDNFSARWTRTMTFERGAYRFTAGADDGVRVWVDNSLIIDAWRDQGFTSYNSSDIFLDGGTHSVRMEYYEHGGGAAARLSWKQSSSGSGGGGSDWTGQYFNNRTLSGSPTFTRSDSAVYFDWGGGGPGNGVGSDNFSARWTKTLNVPRSGYYRIYGRADDGVRVWVDNSLVINGWVDQGATTYGSPWLFLAAGNHALKAEYYENGGGSFMHLYLEPAFYTEFYTNRTLSGSPASTGYYTAVSWDWGNGGPAGVSDNFSARFTGSLSLSGGDYSLCTRTDDGVRLWVDGSMIIDQWRDMGSTTYCATRSLNKGFHDIKMEYYENGGYAYARLWWDKQGGPNALGGAGSPALSMADPTESDIRALYNDHGYMGGLTDADLPRLSIPRLFIPMVPR